MTLIEQAQAMAQRDFCRYARKQLEALLASGQAEWKVDPSVANVVGLLKTGTNTAYVVFYLDKDDFEASHEFEWLCAE